MPTGQRPKYRFLTKTEGNPKFTEVGAAWELAKADTFSGSITIDGVKHNFLIVKNEPKPPAAKKASAKKASSNVPG